MIKIDDDLTTIHMTRGDWTNDEYDRIAFYFPIWDYEEEEETKYEFQLTDELSFYIYEKKGYTKKPITTLTWNISDYFETATTTPIIPFDELEDIFEETSKPKTYFYELKLNHHTTIIGSDEDGDKKLIVYPSTYEGGSE